MAVPSLFDVRILTLVPRKLFGGGMRQIGVLTASCAYALNNHFPLLPAVHALAQRIEQGLVDLGAVIWSSAETCMVRFIRNSRTCTHHLTSFNCTGVLRSLAVRSRVRRDR